MRSRRDTELWLLIAALPILVLLFAMLLINQRQDLTFSSFAVPLGLFAAFVLAHLTTRRFAPNADPALLPISFLLSGIGICFVMRLAPSLAMKQLCWLFLGIAAMVVTLILVRSLENLANYKYSVMIVGLLLLLLPAVIGTEIYGSKIWITFAGFSFQPGEIAKVLIVIFLAAYMAQNRELLSVSNKRFLGLQIPHLRTLAPLLIMWAIAMLIVVFERDLGSAMLVFGIFLIMLYVCSGRPAYVIVGALLVLLGLTAAYFCFDHVQVRMKAWLHPFDYPKDAGYQIIQATYSMADGGLFGTGIGRGMPTKIPVVASDFIFAAIAEEMGLLGAAGILIAFMLFAIRGFLTAARAKSDLAAFTATGLTTAIALQAFVIVGGITRVIPLTGLTLPFMSQGGSSLLASFIILALLLRAGHEGSGMGTELQGTVRIDGGVLGRVALGRRLTQLVTCFTVLFAVLIGALTWVQVVRADYYRNLPNNNHAIERNAQIERGSILTSDNVVLAQSVLSDDGTTYERVYPQGDLAAHVVGYYSVQYGSAGIEAHENSELAGKTGTSSWSQAIGRMASGGTPGNDVMLTLDASVQQVAQDALAGKTGAVVAIDPRTGRILAMASTPGYDPANIAAILEGDDGTSSLYNRATQALYAPGSTFKMLTLSAALESGLVKPDSLYESPASIEIGGGSITNYGNEDHGTVTVARAMTYSSNTVFAQISDQLGAAELLRACGRFGIGTPFGQDFEVTPSLVPKASEMTQWETAWFGVGQPVGEHESPAGPQVSVMQMALVGCAVANDGVIMDPYLVDKVIANDGSIMRTTSPRQLTVAMSADTAATERAIMAQSIKDGSGAGARVPGVNVAGKTGTAQTGKPVDDAWFVGMAPAENPTVVVAVIVEQGGTGAGTAAPIAGDVLEASLKAQGVIS